MTKALFPRSIAARCGSLLLGCSGAFAAPVSAQAMDSYSADEVTRSLLRIARVDGEGLQLHRWLTGAVSDPPAGTGADVISMTRVLTLSKAMNDTWVDGIYGREASESAKRHAKELLAQAGNAGASRCTAHRVDAQPVGAPLEGITFDRFPTGALPADAQRLDVQYRCIASHASAQQVLSLAMIDWLSGGQRPAGGALTADIVEAMASDRRWPRATGGQLTLVSLHGGRAWLSDEQELQGMLRRRMLSMRQRQVSRTADATTRAAVLAGFAASTAQRPSADELQTQVMLWIPPSLRDALRDDVMAYIAAAPPIRACRPGDAHLIGDEEQQVRLDLQCSVPGLDHVPVPVMPSSLTPAALEQHYRQVLTGLRLAILEAGHARVGGVTYLQWNPDNRAWEMAAGAHAALQVRALLPTAVVDEWGAPSNISRFLPAALRQENLDAASLDQDSRDRVEQVRLLLAGG